MELRPVLISVQFRFPVSSHWSITDYSQLAITLLLRHYLPRNIIIELEASNNSHVSFWAHPSRFKFNGLVHSGPGGSNFEFIKMKTDENNPADNPIIAGISEIHGMKTPIVKKPTIDPPTSPLIVWQASRIPSKYFDM